MAVRSPLLDALGGEEGCYRLSAAFYSRVAKEPALRPLFPGKSLRCATEEFGSFLVQFLGGDEEQTQHRWWLSLRESHARFRIGAAERSAWLKQMAATLDAASLDEDTRAAFRQLFLHSSAYVIGKEAPVPLQQEIAARWREQAVLDEAVAAIAAGEEDRSLDLAARFAQRPVVFLGLLVRMIQARRPALLGFVLEAVERDPSLRTRRFAGRALLHFASEAGALEVVALLLRIGCDPDIEDRGGHTPLYSVANGNASPAGAEVVRALLRAGADVHAHGGVTRATPLHMAARRGHVEIARVLIAHGANVNAKDRKGDTPLQRAIHCRKNEVASVLREGGH